MTKPFLGADNVFGFKQPDVAKAERALGDLFDALAIDWRNDPNMQDTPQRVTKMYIEEIMKGRYTPPPKVTSFATDRSHNSLLISGPWDIRSLCSHHLMLVSGVAIIGILPKEDSKLAGLSKYGRIVDWFSSRPQLQEGLVEDIADYLFDTIRPQGLGVYISAKHSCCSFRGIKSNSSMFTTTSLRGTMLSIPEQKTEFLMECHALLRNYTAI